MKRILIISLILLTACSTHNKEKVDAAKEHIYYINDVIVGSIDIEIFTNTQYGRPKIIFEILQNNMCHMTKEHKLEIVFPE